MDKTSNQYLNNPEYHSPTMTWPGRVESSLEKQSIERLQEAIREGNVLEIGSSAGLTTEELGHIFGPNVQVTGIEINKKMFGESKTAEQEKYKNIAYDHQSSYREGGKEPLFARADGYNPPFAENTFKCVFMMNNIYNVISKNRMTPQRQKEVFSNILRVIAPQGFLCIAGLGENGSEYLIIQLDEQKKAHIFDDQTYSEPVFQQIKTALNIT